MSISLLKNIRITKKEGISKSIQTLKVNKREQKMCLTKDRPKLEYT